MPVLEDQQTIYNAADALADEQTQKNRALVENAPTEQSTLNSGIDFEKLAAQQSAANRSDEYPRSDDDTTDAAVPPPPTPPPPSSAADTAPVTPTPDSTAPQDTTPDDGTVERARAIGASLPATPDDATLAELTTGSGTPSVRRIMGSAGHPPPAVGEKPPLVEHTPRLEPPMQRYKDLEKDDPKLFQAINHVADATGVPRRDLAAVVYAASNNDPNAQHGARVGYGGLTQQDADWVDPDKSMDANDPIDNLFMTAEKLKRLGDKYGRGTPEQYAAYWAGTDQVDAMLRRHPDDHAAIAAPGTFNFVNRVIGRAEPHDDGHKSSDMPAWMDATAKVASGADQTGRQAVGAQITDAQPSWWDNVVNTAQGASDAMYNTAQGVGNAVVGAAGSAAQTAQGVSDAMYNTAQQVPAVAGQAATAIQQAPAAIGSAVARAAEVIKDPQQLGQVAADLVHQGVSALTSAATSVGGALKQQALGAAQAAAPVVQGVGNYATGLVEGATGDYGGGANIPKAAPTAPPEPTQTVEGSPVTDAGVEGDYGGGGTPGAPTGTMVAGGGARPLGEPPPPPSQAIGAPPAASTPAPTTGSGSGAAPATPPVGGAGTQPSGAGTGGAASPPAAPPAGAAPASGAAPVSSTQPPVTSLPGGPSHITPSGAVIAARNGGPDGVLTYIIDNGRAGATTGQNWRELEGAFAAAAFANGNYEAALHAHEYVYQLQHAGTFEHLKNAYNAMRVGDLPAAAQELAVSHNFATDGATAGFQIINGKLYFQRFSEDTHQPLGKAHEVTLDNMRGMLNISANPKDWNGVLNQERTTNATIEHNQAEEQLTREGHEVTERVAKMREEGENARAEAQRAAADARAQAARDQALGFEQDRQRQQTIAELKAQRQLAIKEANDTYSDMAPTPATDITGTPMTAEQKQQAQAAYVGIRTHAPEIPTLMAQDIVKSLLAPKDTKGIKFTATPVKDQNGTDQIVIRNLQGDNVAYIPTADLRALYPTTQLTPSQQRASGKNAAAGRRQ